MSTVGEIEAAIDHFSTDEQHRVRDWLLSRPLATEPRRARTGAELAKIWPAGFHLTPAEADEFAADLDASRPAAAIVRTPINFLP